MYFLEFRISQLIGVVSNRSSGGLPHRHRKTGISTVAELVP